MKNNETSAAASEAKPCPFCGEKPDLIKHPKDPMWSLLHRCAVMGTLAIEWREDLNDIVRQWNVRAPVKLFGVAKSVSQV